MSEGKKYDGGKPRMDLLPYDALVQIAEVLGFGAQKYTPGNWAKGIEISRLIASLERHLGEFKEGRDHDSESSLHHMAHVGANVLFILWMLRHHPELDNRWIKETLEKKPLPPAAPADTVKIVALDILTGWPHDPDAERKAKWIAP
jgi:Domain of unknown function (DUF5664)